jgi:hypothetical protein
MVVEDFIGTVWQLDHYVTGYNVGSIWHIVEGFPANALNGRPSALFTMVATYGATGDQRWQVSHQFLLEHFEQIKLGQPTTYPTTYPTTISLAEALLAAKQAFE